MYCLSWKHCIRTAFDKVPEVQNNFEILSGSSTPPHRAQPTNGELLHVMKKYLIY